MSTIAAAVLHNGEPVRDANDLSGAAADARAPGRTPSPLGDRGPQRGNHRPTVAVATRIVSGWWKSGAATWSTVVPPSRIKRSGLLPGDATEDDALGESAASQASRPVHPAAHLSSGE